MLYMLFRLLAAFISMVLMACGPLVPLHHPKERLDNPPIVFESNEIKLSLQFLKRKYGHNVFALTITKQTESEMVISPKSISLYASNKPFPLPMGGEDLDSISLVNSQLMPRRVWAKSKQEVMRLTEEAANNRAAIGAFFTILTVGAIVYDAAQDNEDSQKEYFTRSDAQRATMRNALVASGQLSSEIAFSSVNNVIDYGYAVSNEIFSEGMLWAHEPKEGLIFIPNPATYRYTRVIIPVNNIDYVFDFRLKGRKPPH